MALTTNSLLAEYTYSITLTAPYVLACVLSNIHSFQQTMGGWQICLFVKENTTYCLKRQLGERLSVDPSVFELIYGRSEVMKDGIRLRRYFLHEGSV